METIKAALLKYCETNEITDITPELTLAPENTGADFSTNLAMQLAKYLHKSPMAIAEEIKSSLESEDFTTDIAAPGFLNFTFKDAYWQTALEKLATIDFSSDELKNQTVLTEFSDPNPFKVLHVGHLYTSIVGDAISRLLENAGGNVKRLNFGGDVGLHVAKNLYILKDQDAEVAALNALPDGSERTAKIAELLGRCYVAGTRAYDDDGAAHAEITKLNKLIYQISENGPEYIYQDLDKNPAYADYSAEDVTKIAQLYWWGRTASYQYFADFYANLGLKFDEFIPESTVAGLGKDKVLENTPGTYQKSDGAIIFKGEDYGLHTRVFINKEGIPTYEAKDVGLIFKKAAKYHFDKSIVITGDEQKEYMRVVMKSIEQYAPELIKKSTHLTHGMVKLPGAVKMSSRKGNFLRAIDIINLVKETLKQEYNSEDEKIALGAIKYAFLKAKLGGDIELDIKESISMTGNSGPYLQYSAVRAKKILERNRQGSLNNESAPLGKSYNVYLSEERPDHRSSEDRLNVVTFVNSRRSMARSVNPDGPFKEDCGLYERTLTKKLTNYPVVLQEATADLAPHKLATYLYDLAQEFSRFYEHCPVAGSENEATRRKIVEQYLKAITHGLNILGIEIPERM